MKPNLFKWATSELTQDAFICWLIEWGKPENRGCILNELANIFIEELSNIKSETIQELEVRRQYKGIDILVVLNKKMAILIEDKVHTQNHSNQLTRYAEILKKEFKEEDISLVYLKTGDQSNYKKVESKGYQTYKREDFLKLLNEGKKKGLQNEIFLDFLRHLTSIDDSVNSYKELPVEEWHWNSWKGFYIELQKRLGQGDWDYVPQKNGGFLGFWWHWNYKDYEKSGFDYYLMIEHGKFCFKIYPYDVKLNYEIREYYRNLLFRKSSEYGIKIKRNGRCEKGKTKTLTVAKLENNYLKTDINGFIDIEQTIQEIRKIEKMIKEI